MDDVKAIAVVVAISVVCLFGFCWKACTETCKSYRDCVEHAKDPGICGTRC